MKKISGSPSSSELQEQLLARDMAFAKIIEYLQANGLEAHTNLNGKTVVVPRQNKLRKEGRTGQGPATDE